MKKTITTLFLGAVLGFGIATLIPTASASVARIVGGSGYVMGIDVTINGNTLCSDPYYWEATKELECE